MIYYISISSTLAMSRIAYHNHKIAPHQKGTSTSYFELDTSNRIPNLSTLPVSCIPQDPIVSESGISCISWVKDSRLES